MIFLQVDRHSFRGRNCAIIMFHLNKESILREMFASLGANSNLPFRKGFLQKKEVIKVDFL